MIRCALLKGELEIDPASVLSLAEAGLLSPSAVAKRRNDFLRGRWVAKRLLIQAFPGTRLADHVVMPNEDGVPVACEPSLVPRGVSLSITHTEGYAAAALTELPICVGIDAERPLTNHELIIRDYFTPGERALVARHQVTAGARVAATIWSMKESVTKAIGKGLRIPLLSIDVRDASEGPFDVWCPLRVECSSCCPPGSSLAAWSWQIPEVVVTIAAIAPVGTPLPLPPARWE